MSVGDDVVRVAIAGCHRMVTPTLGVHNWAAAFAAAPETMVVAVFDRGAETREEFRACWRDVWGDVPGYDDYDLMLREARPDLVCVATRQTMHADQIEAAVGAGVRGILCDKPLSTSLEEADRILSACEGAPVPLAFGLDRRWFESYRTVRRLLNEGIVGTVTGVLAFGVPNLINHGCHSYDTALALAGDPEPVWASGSVDDVSDEPADSRRRLDPPGRAWIGLSNGAHLAIMQEGGPQVGFTVLGTEGRLAVLNDAGEVYLWTMESGALADRPRAVDLPASPDPWPTGPAGAVRDLVETMRTGGTTACDVQEARRATEIGFGIHASSAANGARIPIPVADRALCIESFPWGNE